MLGAASFIKSAMEYIPAAAAAVGGGGPMAMSMSVAVAVSDSVASVASLVEQHTPDGTKDMLTQVSE